jgi:hypothetical protein
MKSRFGLLEKSLLAASITAGSLVAASGEANANVAANRSVDNIMKTIGRPILGEVVYVNGPSSPFFYAQEQFADGKRIISLGLSEIDVQQDDPVDEFTESCTGPNFKGRGHYLFVNDEGSHSGALILSKLCDRETLTPSEFTGNQYSLDEKYYYPTIEFQNSPAGSVVHGTPENSSTNSSSNGS